MGAAMLDAILSTKSRSDFDMHTYISMAHRYMFHAVGKAANSSVKAMLYEREIAGTFVRAVPSVHDRNMSPLISPYQLHADDLERVLTGEEFFRFTFVRNPYSRLLSCYLDRIKAHSTRPYKELIRAMGRKQGYEPTFEEFVRTICTQTSKQQNNHWRVQADDAMTSVVDYHMVGRQESFAADFVRIHMRIFGAPPAEGAVDVNASPSSTSAAQRLAEYWTDDLVALVRKRYAADFDVFGYSPDLARTA
ncbi:hypothetical protein DXV76_20990 [Rhodobacteraceae bacterium CCMM004]|nr:hypothetical protein DXV76_20990 [Rhodobacteraceae bacterium CCMM004]